MRGAATKVGTANDNGILGIGLTEVDEAHGVGGRDASEGVGAKLLVLVGLRRDKGEVLCGNDLVGVDVVVDDITKVVEGGAHARLNVCGLERDRNAVARV